MLASVGASVTAGAVLSSVGAGVTAGAATRPDATAGANAFVSPPSLPSFHVYRRSCLRVASYSRARLAVVFSSCVPFCFHI